MSDTAAEVMSGVRPVAGAGRSPSVCLTGASSAPVLEHPLLVELGPGEDEPQLPLTEVAVDDFYWEIKPRKVPIEDLSSSADTGGA